LGVSAVFAVAAVLLAFALFCAFRVGSEANEASRMAAETVPMGDQEPKGAIAAAVTTLSADLKAALRYIAADRRLLTVIVMVGAHCSFTMAFDSMLPALSDKVGGSEGLYGSILIALGGGALLGTLGVSQLQKASTRATSFVASGIASGLSIALLGVATSPSLVLPAAVLAGMSQASYMALSATLVQGVVADRFRARVMSLYIMIAAGHMAILNLGFGQFAEVVEVQLLLVVPGLIWVALFLGLVLVLPEARSVAVRGRFTHDEQVAGASI
jgi:hypothetical protein